MAGTIAYVRGLENRSGRMKLKPGDKVYWRAIIGRLALGYQRRQAGTAGRWIVRSYIGNEKYRKLPIGLADDYEASDGDTILTFEEASERVRQNYNLGASSGEAPLSILTVDDAMAAYVAWLKTHKATGRAAEQCAAKQILPTLGKVRLSELTTAQLIQWRDGIAKQPALIRSRPGAPQNYRPAPVNAEGRRARQATTNRIWTILRAALNKAFHDGHVASDLAWRRVTPFRQTSAARPGYLTADQATRLVNAADPDLRLLVRGALETGCRYGELAAAKVRDYEGGKLYIAKSKTGRPRSVVLSDSGAAFFHAITVGRDPTALIFQRQGRQWQKSEQARPMRAACDHARIAPAVSINALRHTWASLSVMGGMPLMVVARNMGHRDTRMVEKHYGHLREDYVDRVVREHAPRYQFEPLSGQVRSITR